MPKQATGVEPRKAEYPIDRLFLDRWSPRAMSEAEIDRETLFSLLEAARWAPSCFNNQPWRFIYGLRNTPYWKPLFDLLVEPNKVWAKNAAAFVLVISKKTFDHNGKPAPTHSFDTGAAWQNLALQGFLKGLVVHGMAGFDYARAATDFKIPADYQVEAMVVVGKPGRKEDLPPGLQEREFPSGRKPLGEVAFEGRFDSHPAAEF